MSALRAALGGFARILDAIPLAIALCMILPNAVIAILSFSGDDFIKFPPMTWGFRQYVQLFTAGSWNLPLLRSVVVASAASSVAVLIGLSAVFALHRVSPKIKSFVDIVGTGPLLAPGVAYAVAVYALLARIGLVGNVWSIIVVHATLAMPFVLLITGSAALRVPAELELAALSLGAERLQAWRDVTVRFLAPAIAASWLFAFVTSLDETVVTVFLAGPGFVTLPVAIFSSVRQGVDPVITAIATLLTAATSLLLFAYGLLRRQVP